MAEMRDPKFARVADQARRLRRSCKRENWCFTLLRFCASSERARLGSCRMEAVEHWNDGELVGRVGACLFLFFHKMLTFCLAGRALRRDAGYDRLVWRVRDRGHKARGGRAAYGKGPSGCAVDARGMVRHKARQRRARQRQGRTRQSEKKLGRQGHFQWLQACVMKPVRRIRRHDGCLMLARRQHRVTRMVGTRRGYVCL